MFGVLDGSLITNTINIANIGKNNVGIGTIVL